MNGEQLPSALVRFLSVAFFAILTLSALTWFVISIIGLISEFHMNGPVVGFDKGSMYMLGIGLGLLLLTIGGGMQGLFGRTLTAKKETLFTRGLFICLILMVTLPQMADYLVANYAKKQHYTICSDATYRWLLYSKFYYTKSETTCNELANEKENTKSSSGR